MVTDAGAPVPWPAVTCVTVIVLPVVLLTEAWVASISITFAVHVPPFPTAATVHVTAVMTVYVHVGALLVAVQSIPANGTFTSVLTLAAFPTLSVPVSV